MKTGWLLGGNPRAQFYAQLFGVAVGAAVIVPALGLLIPDPSVLGSDEWPAPSCVVWAGVKAFAGGLGALDAQAKRAIAAGLSLGVVLALAERFAPRRVRPYLPSPSGLGLSMVIPGSNAIAMFIGAWAPSFSPPVRRSRPTSASPSLPGSSPAKPDGVLIVVLKVSGLLSM